LAFALAALSATAVILPISSWAQDEAASAPQTIFFKANTRYHDGAYEDAAREYQRLLESGIESGNLFFNLGNAYFKVGDVGRAILNYERAALFMPSDPDLAANLAYARSLTGVEPCEVPLWQRAAFPLRGRMSSTSLGWLVCGLWALTFGALIVQRLVRWQGRAIVYAATAFAVVSGGDRRMAAACGRRWSEGISGALRTGGRRDGALFATGGGSG
jgi:tetratricopeptide (TPR) repeat protein